MARTLLKKKLRKAFGCCTKLDKVLRTAWSPGKVRVRLSASPHLAAKAAQLAGTGAQGRDAEGKVAGLSPRPGREDPGQLRQVCRQAGRSSGCGPWKVCLSAPRPGGGSGEGAPPRGTKEERANRESAGPWKPGAILGRSPLPPPHATGLPFPGGRPALSRMLPVHPLLLLLLLLLSCRLCCFFFPPRSWPGSGRAGRGAQPFPPRPGAALPAGAG